MQDDWDSKISRFDEPIAILTYHLNGIKLQSLDGNALYLKYIETRESCIAESKKNMKMIIAAISGFCYQGFVDELNLFKNTESPSND